MIIKETVQELGNMTIKEVVHGLEDGTIHAGAVPQDAWPDISEFSWLSEEFIRRYADQVDWANISHFQKLSEGFIDEYADRVDWWWISVRQKLSEDTIRRYEDRVDWVSISKYQRLSENFIHEHAGQVEWSWISAYQKLSENFICKYADQVKWREISAYQKLSEKFIRRYADRVYWPHISRYQSLSEAFIEEFKGQVDWWRISKHQYLSVAFIQKYKDRLCMILVQDNWAYKTPEELEYAVRDTSLYECHKGYFIAYKGIRKDRYSDYNFQYQYLPGETYETFADCSDKADSCGFSVWTRGGAEKYWWELVVPCRIEYKDVARIIYEDGRIRCRKMTILG